MFFKKEKKHHPVLVMTLTGLSLIGAYTLGNASKKKMQCICHTVKRWFCKHEMTPSDMCDCMDQ